MPSLLTPAMPLVDWLSAFLLRQIAAQTPLWGDANETTPFDDSCSFLRYFERNGRRAGGDVSVRKQLSR
jgi:hypothetical protein